MLKKSLLLTGVLVGCGGNDSSSSNPPPPPVKPAEELEFTADVEPLFKRSCQPCHAGAEPKAGLSLDSKEKIVANFQKAKGKISAGAMPPPGSGKTPISSAELNLVASWIGAGAK